MRDHQRGRVRPSAPVATGIADEGIRPLTSGATWGIMTCEAASMTSTGRGVFSQAATTGHGAYILQGRAITSRMDTSDRFPEEICFDVAGSWLKNEKLLLTAKESDPSFDDLYAKPLEISMGSFANEIERERSFDEAPAGLNRRMSTC